MSLGTPVEVLPDYKALDLLYELYRPCSASAKACSALPLVLIVVRIGVYQG